LNREAAREKDRSTEPEKLSGGTNGEEEQARNNTSAGKIMESSYGILKNFNRASILIEADIGERARCENKIN